MSLLNASDEESMLVQTCVYWAPGLPGRQGQPSWAAPVELACRWDAARSNPRDAQVETLQKDARVYLAQDVLERGMLALQGLSSSTPDDPRSVVGAREIRKFTKTPNREGDELVRTAHVGGG